MNIIIIVNKYNYSFVVFLSSPYSDFWKLILFLAIVIVELNLPQKDTKTAKKTVAALSNKQEICKENERPQDLLFSKFW